MSNDPKRPPGDIPVGKLVPTGKPAKPADAPKPARKPAPPPSAPVPVAPPAAPPAAAPLPGEYDVELVAIPIPPAKPRLPRDQRPLYDLDRRDFIMLGTGVAGTLMAILAALGLAKALRKKPPE